LLVARPCFSKVLMLVVIAFMYRLLIKLFL
jgi:hypothetical protein